MLGHKLLVSLLHKKDVAEYYNAKLSEKYFVSEELKLYQFIENHLKDHSALPAISTVVETFGDMPTTPEPVSYYLAKVEEQFACRAFNNSLQNSADLLKTKKISELVKQHEEVISLVKNSESRFNILDFGKDAAQLFQNLHTATFYHENGIQLGWKSLDKMTEGMVAGDIFSIVGRPASGKTFLGMWVAYQAFLNQGRTVLFVSMEMSIPSITQRMVAIMTQANMTTLKKGMLSNLKQDETFAFINALNDFENRLYFVDGSLKSTVGDIAALINQFKPDLVVVDGAYLLKHKNGKLDRFTRVAENVEHLKQVAEQNKIPMLLSYQFNREASKKKAKGEKPSLEDIGYSDAIGQISSVVLGLMQPESTETLNERVITVLKGRNGGENTTFNIKWDFANVNFSEISSANSLSEDDDDHDGYKSQDGNASPYSDDDYND